MVASVFTLFIFTGYTVTADLQFATKEHCEEVRAQIEKPRVAFKAQCVETKVVPKTFVCDPDNYSYLAEGNHYVHKFPAIRKIKCRETFVTK